MGTPVASPIVGTPVSIASPVVIVVAGSPSIEATPREASPMASPSTEARPIESPVSVGSPVGSPGAASPIAQATATVTEATPNATEAIQTAEAGYDSYRDAVFGVAHLPEKTLRQVGRPSSDRPAKGERFPSQRRGSVGAAGACRPYFGRYQGPGGFDLCATAGRRDFEQTANEQSNDTATAENGGDLGWFTRGQIVAV